MTTTTTHRMVSPGIVVDPEHRGGEPCISGRGTPAGTVAALALDGYRPALIHVWGLTDNQIDDALRWDHEGRPG